MNEQPSTPLFTAAQLARPLGKTKRAVLFALADVPATQVPAAGGMASAWTLAALPPSWRSELAAQAQRRLFPSVEALLTDTRTGWQPPLPLAQIDQRFIDRAVLLQRALTLPLQRQHELIGSALNDLGLSEYRRAFGHSISAKQWRRLLDRTTRRDGGLENWQRLDLYLDDAAFRSRTPTPSRAKARFNHQALDDVLVGMENRAEPTAEDKAWLFHETFKHFEALSAQPADARAVKASILDHLHAAFGPALSKTPEALRRAFDEKLATWIEGGRTLEALQDRRRLASGNFRTPDFSTDLREIAKRAVQLDGNESAARRRLLEEGKLSEEFQSYYPFDPRRDKSALPNKVRQSITSLVNATVPYRRGHKSVRDAGPHITRDWSNVQPGDWFVYDDVTWNHLFKVRQPDGSWDVLRGECLVGIDEKSEYPLDFLLINGKYNGLHVRRLVAKIHDRLGLPRAGMTLERGVWKSRFVVGASEREWQPLHWRNFEAGLSDPRIGVRIHHATSPRAKVIEGFFHHLQDRMRDIPGFVGFNEREYKMERMQGLIARARRGDEEALAQFPTQDQWRDKIRSVMEEHRNDPGNGARLDGASPAEAWNKTMLSTPLRRLSTDARHLLSTHEKIVSLTSKGLLVKLPGNEAVICYCNEHTDQLLARGERRVRVLINLEVPEQITCFDMKGLTRFTVRGQLADAKDATREHLTELSQLRRAHRSSAKALFGEIQHGVSSTISRDNEQNETTLEEGKFQRVAAEAHQAQETDAQRLRREINRLSDELGEPPPNFATQRIPLKQKLDALKWKVEQRARNGATEHNTP